jgi:hypothetical protein
MKVDLTEQQISFLLQVLDPACVTEQQVSFLLQVLDPVCAEPRVDEVYSVLHRAYESYKDAKKFIEDNCDYELSENQENFAIDAFVAGYEVSFDYSGRGMFGRKCPSISVMSREDFSSSSHFLQDNMGIGKVLYAHS